MKSNRGDIQFGDGEKSVIAEWRMRGLSRQEKEAMHAVLSRTVRESRRNHARQVSQDAFQGVFRVFFMSRPFAYALASLVLLLSSGLGVAKASDDSLPGEWLYTVKVNVKEPLERVMLRDTEKKAVFEKTLIKRRINEAETLAEQGKLGSNETEILEKLVEKHRISRSQESAGVAVTAEDDFFVEVEREAKKIEIREGNEEGEIRYRIRMRADEARHRDESEITEREDESGEEEDDRESNERTESASREDRRESQSLQSSGTLKSGDKATSSKGKSDRPSSEKTSSDSRVNTSSEKKSDGDQGGSSKKKEEEKKKDSSGSGSSDGDRDTDDDKDEKDKDDDTDDKERD